MGLYERAAWGTVIGLSLMLMGGLMLWAYGVGRKRQTLALPTHGPEVVATQIFHTRLARWFIAYGVAIILAGFATLVWAARILV